MNDITESVTGRCKLCKTEAANSVKLGRKYLVHRMVIHGLCWVFAYAREGFLNYFHLSDILDDAFTHKCMYCKRRGAASSCYACYNYFHFPCGMNQGARPVSESPYAMACHKHIPKQKVPLSRVLTDNEECVICLQDVNISGRKNIIWAPCCKTKWYHRPCLQEYAHHAGNIFKCSACGNTQQFRLEMRWIGVFIPIRPATWYPSTVDKLNRIIFFSCKARFCYCSLGRRYVTDSPSDWSSHCCTYCEGNEYHFSCASTDFGSLDDHICRDCIEDPSRGFGVICQSCGVYDKTKRRTLTLYDINYKCSPCTSNPGAPSIDVITLD